MANELDRAELIQEVARLSMQGRSNADIARQKGISPHTVSKYIAEWENYIKDRADSNPELFDKFLQNSLKFIENYDYMLSQAWEVHEEAKEAGVPATRLSSIKLIQELTAQKARLYQLLGPRVDTNYLDKAKRAERVNSILSEILRDVMGECERCYPMAWDRLRDAFTMMEKDIQSNYNEYEEVPVGELVDGNASEED